MGLKQVFWGIICVSLFTGNLEVKLLMKGKRDLGDTYGDVFQLPYPYLSLPPFLSHQVAQVIRVINAHVRRRRVGRKSLERKRKAS